MTTRRPSGTESALPMTDEELVEAMYQAYGNACSEPPPRGRGEAAGKRRAEYRLNAWRAALAVAVPVIRQRALMEAERVAGDRAKEWAGQVGPERNRANARRSARAIEAAELAVIFERMSLSTPVQRSQESGAATRHSGNREGR